MDRGGHSPFVFSSYSFFSIYFAVVVWLLQLSNFNIIKFDKIVWYNKQADGEDVDGLFAR